VTRNQHRLVVKIGSQVLCDEAGGLDLATLDSLVDQVAEVRTGGWQVLLVSSGAVAAGSGMVQQDALRSGNPVTRRQVLAAAGQVRLMSTYQARFHAHGLNVAQVLATKSDFQSRGHYLNMRACIEGVLAAGMVPIVNENDVVSVTELMFTDNDELASLLAGMVGATHLCLLSNVPGVFAAAGADGQASVIECWDEGRHSLEETVRSGTSRLGRGGMHSKLAVARKTAALGIEVSIADGRDPQILLELAAGRPRGTRFPARGTVSPAKRWLATMDEHALGSVTVNEGAAQALRDRARLASLLPVGLLAVDGEFQRGDVIQVRDPSGRVLGCGRAQYDHEEARAVLGQRDQKPLIHYDYLYLND